MSRADSQFKLRMPANLRTQVEAAARTANRSLNAEVVTRLQASFSEASAAAPAKCLDAFLSVLVIYLWQVRSGRNSEASLAAYKSVSGHLNAAFLLGAISHTQWRRICHLSDNALLVADWERAQQ